MDRILSLMGAKREGMKRSFSIALVVACCLGTGPRLSAQAQEAGSSQNQPAAEAQKPAANEQKPGSTKSESNPFPEDTTSVPVLPTSSSPAAAAPDMNSDSSKARLPEKDMDPVRSPDDPAGSAPSGNDDSSSSSLQGLDQLLPAPGADIPEKQVPTHQVGAKEDLSVGSFYLDQKNWKGALSRFESALVLDPENPDVYWGLAESERHLGKYSEAKAHYQKVVEYDPGSKRAKEASRQLKQPELANAPAVSSNATTSQPKQ